MTIRNEIDRPKYFSLLIFGNNSKLSPVIGKLGTKSQNKFSRKLRLLPEQNFFYLKVGYALGGYNDGFYSSKKDLLFAYQAFVE